MVSARRVVSGLCVALVACSSSKSTPPALRPAIEVKELTVRFEGSPIARLHADGRTESVGNSKPGKDATFSPGPTLHGDGTIDLTKPGFTARIEADGDIVVVSPSEAKQPDQPFGRVVGDQILLAGSRDSGVRLEGTKLVMFHESKVTNEIGVVDPPALGRTALVMTAAFIIDMAIASR
jgi:hypothetical protein